MKGDCNADAFLSASTAFKKTYPRYLADNVSEIPDSTIFYSLTSSPIVFSTGSRGGGKKFKSKRNISISTKEKFLNIGILFFISYETFYTQLYIHICYKLYIIQLYNFT